MNYTRQLLLIPLIILSAITANAQSFGSFASGVFINQNGNLNTYNVTGDGTPNEIGPGAPGFTGSLGSFGQNSGTLTLAGAEVKTYKNPGANACEPILNYRIRPAGTSSGAYTNLNLPFKANCAGSVFDDGLGPCSGNDQKWSTQAAAIDLTNQCPGTYTLDLYYSIPGSSSSTSACNQNSNIGSLFVPAGSMTFTITNTLTATASAGPPVCQGNPVALNGAASGGAAPYTYSWSDPQNNTFDYSQNTTVTAPGTYTLGVYDQCNNSTTATTTVTVNPLPAAPAISGPNTVCPGTTTTLTASGCNGDVTWSDGTTGSTLTAAPGTYTATCTMDGCTSPASDPVTVTATCTIEGCTGVESLPLVISEVSVSTPVISGADTICRDATTTLTASNCNGNVVWSNGDTGNTITVPPGSYTARCVDSGCSSERSIQKRVVARHITRPGFAGRRTICSGTTATITAQNCAGMVTWSTGATGPTANLAPGTYTATCTIDGCSGLESLPLVIEELPTPAPPAVTSSGTLCPSGNATLTATGCTGSLLWSNGATSDTINVPQGSYTARCTMDGCRSAATTPVRVLPCRAAPCPPGGNLVKNGSFERPVVTDPLLWEQVVVPNWTNDTDSGRIELQRNKFAIASDGSQYAELNGNVPGDIYQDITVPATAQSLNWSLDHRGRENAQPVDMQTITVVLSAADGSNPQTVVHTASITGWEQVAGVYQTLPGQTSVRIRVISSAGNDIPGRGNFIDNVRANYVGCTAAAREAEQEAAPAAMRPSLSLSVQPNPVLAQAALVLTGFDDGILSIDIVSANGTISKNMKVPYSTGTKLILDMAGFRDGMYFIKVQQQGKTATAKFTKQQ